MVVLFSGLLVVFLLENLILVRPVSVRIKPFGHIMCKRMCDFDTCEYEFTYHLLECSVFSIRPQHANRPGFLNTRLMLTTRSEDKKTLTTFSPVPDTSLEYQLHTVKVSWSEASDACREEGAELIEPRSRKVFGSLFKRILSTLPKETQAVWIGLSDKFDNDTWYWGSGERVSGRGMWGKGEPANIDEYGKQNCAFMNLAASGYFRRSSCWCDANCAGMRPFVCARKRHP